MKILKGNLCKKILEPLLIIKPIITKKVPNQLLKNIPKHQKNKLIHQYLELKIQPFLVRKAHLWNQAPPGQ